MNEKNKLKWKTLGCLGDACYYTRQPDDKPNKWQDEFSDVLELLL